MRQLLRAARTALPLACLMLALGCSGGAKKAPYGPVSGTVTVGGQPVTAGQVTFIPINPEKGAGGLSGATIGSDGKYTIYTEGKAGAPLGKYKVTVSPSMVPTGDGKPPTTPFSTKYTRVDTTPLERDVTDNAPAGTYDLKLEK